MWVLHYGNVPLHNALFKLGMVPFIDTPIWVLRKAKSFLDGFRVTITFGNIHILFKIAFHVHGRSPNTN
jgi:hypothetical protein